MSEKSGSRRFAAVLAVLLLLLAAPLSAPAFADTGRVDLSVIPDSPELLAAINNSSTPPVPTTVTYEVFDADGDGREPVTTTAVGGWGETASIHLDDGRYKIRVIADGYLETWYTANSGRDWDTAFVEVFGYQQRHTFASAEVIVVDSVNPDNSSWNIQGFTVLHPSASSISGAVANDARVVQGSFLENVAVELYDEAAPDPDADPVATTLTDENGYYTFQDQAPGTYKVRFQAGETKRWWPETGHRAEAETITLDGANHFNLAYAVFPAAEVAVDSQRVLTLGGQPAVGATLTASPDYIEVGWAGKDCLQRYSWFVGTDQVADAFGPTFVVPLAAGGKPVTARLETAGFGCTYTALASNVVGPVDPSLTITGPNVVVAPVDSTGGTDVTLTFENVTTAGITTVTRLESGNLFPDGGFSSLTDPPLFYDIETTAGFDPALGAEVCITFDTAGMTPEQAAGQHLYHLVGQSWVDITVSSSHGEVCGVTSSFSPFAVGQPRWPFQGFLQPVDNGRTLNSMKAGAAVPIKFGLGGNRGLDILVAGAPSSSAIACPAGTTPDDIEQTVAAGNSSLSYAAGSDTYTFVWKTQKTWAGTCRQFILGLNDGTVHTAMFDFRT